MQTYIWHIILDFNPEEECGNHIPCEKNSSVVGLSRLIGDIIALIQQLFRVLMMKNEME